MNDKKNDIQEEEETELPVLPSRNSVHFREPFSPSRRSHEIKSPPPVVLSSPPKRSQSVRSPGAPESQDTHISSAPAHRSSSVKSPTSQSGWGSLPLRSASLRSPSNPQSAYTREARRRSHDIQKFPGAASPYAPFTPFTATTADSYESREPDPLNHRLSINPSELPPVPKPAGQLTSETQQPRWWLQIQATLWRFGMRIGMRIHDWAPPPPPKPQVQAQAQTKVSVHPPRQEAPRPATKAENHHSPHHDQQPAAPKPKRPKMDTAERSLFNEIDDAAEEAVNLDDFPVWAKGWNGSVVTSPVTPVT